MEPFQDQVTIDAQKPDSRSSGLLSALSLLTLTFVSLCAFLFFSALDSERLGSTPSSASATAPALTPDIANQLEVHPTFEALVSYTDRGFEPARLAVSKGDTVRFTNNSSRELWAASFSSDRATAYPGNSACGTTAFDSCGVLVPREFWQFTFEHEGAWEFRNNIDPDDEGIVEVK